MDQSASPVTACQIWIFTEANRISLILLLRLLPGRYTAAVVIGERNEIYGILQNIHIILFHMQVDLLLLQQLMKIGGIGSPHLYITEQIAFAILHTCLPYILRMTAVRIDTSRSEHAAN